MSIWGEQWQCPHCQWQNVFVRKRCRNCGEAHLEEQPAPVISDNVIDLNRWRAEHEARAMKNPLGVVE